MGEQTPDIATDSLSIGFGNFKGYTSSVAWGDSCWTEYTAKPYIKLYTFTRVGGAVNTSRRSSS